MKRGASIGLATILAAAFALSGCESDTTVATTQDPNEDQALSLSVLGAKGDTLTAAVDNEIVVDTSLPPDLRPEAPPAPTVAATAPSFAPAVVQAPPAQPSTRTGITTQSPAPAPEPKALAQSAPSPQLRPIRSRVREERSDEPPARSGMISKGATLSVVTSRTVCNDDATVGNTVRGELASSIRGTNGAMIPQGAQVVANITSVDKWGAGIGLQVKSVRFGGHSYPVTSRVEYVLPQGTDRGACIREGTRLTVDTKEAITVAALR